MNEQEITTVYIVIGTTGEYSDRNEWYVAAYLNEKDAVKHADKATEWITSRFKSLKDKHDRDDFGDSPYDKDMMVDYTGTDYYTIKSPFYRSFEEYGLLRAAGKIG